MSTIDLTETAVLWFSEAVPIRMMWHGRRWRVSDRPTEPEGLYWGTHAPDFAAWRFQATDEAGVSHVFDLVRQHGTPHWTVAHVYE
ncbi:MAG: hypothetical protein EPO52_06375 [Herbiconiux sp.]|uniref:hypothetical protein n=1 Tax=Herbiconiux sp. TaxID=1871186 RepID=UPI0011F47BE9|nr:hypothetical protein [Herbiconiux sp.]TAJ47828.1 MAG: hypothetical protein EPO52_06375 [Herbiconiux sp.]